MTDRPKPKKHRGLSWPAFIVGLLALQVGLCLIAVYFALSDPTMAVEPDYYTKAVHWDQRAAEQRASNKLGWTQLLSITPDTDALGRRTVIVTITDADHQPVENAVVTLDAYAQARAAQRERLSLKSDTPGRYIGLLPVHHTGLWRFGIIAKRDHDTFIDNVRIDLSYP